MVYVKPRIRLLGRTRLATPVECIEVVLRRPIGVLVLPALPLCTHVLSPQVFEVQGVGTETHV